MHKNNSPIALHMLSIFLIANVLAREKLWNNKAKHLNYLNDYLKKCTWSCSIQHSG